MKKKVGWCCNVLIMNDFTTIKTSPDFDNASPIAVGDKQVITPCKAKPQLGVYECVLILRTP